MLRPYQSAAIDAAWEYMREKKDNSVIVAPTGSGKTYIIAQLIKDASMWGGRVVLLSHVKELLQQSADTLKKLDSSLSYGVYSAGLNSREIHDNCTIAGIQSVYQRAEEFGRVDLILIDECHLIPLDGEGMYRTFLAGLTTINPDARMVGLTATPFRLSSGLICGPNNLFKETCHEIGIRELIRDGYLCRLRSKSGIEKTDLSGVHIRGGDFIQSELEQAMTDQGKVALACSEIAEKTQDRKSVLVFCVGVDHTKLVHQVLSEMDLGEARYILGDTPSDERAESIMAFKAGEIKFLVNCQVLTTGFDAPNIDAIAILRPTMSPGLWYQMCGRGFRMSPGKLDCVILDFGGNALRHGPVDDITVPKKGKEQERKSYKECPNCQEVISYRADVCPDCGYFFKKEEREPRGYNHSRDSSDAPILSDETKPYSEECNVQNVVYKHHRKKNAPENHPATLMVIYDCGLTKAFEWVCLEHQGFARGKAVHWWADRSDQPVPDTVQDALVSINTYGLKRPQKIVLQADGKYIKVVKAWDFIYELTVGTPRDQRGTAHGVGPRGNESAS